MAKRFYKKSISMTRTTLDNCPNEFKKFWAGSVFYQSEQGIFNELRLATLLKIRYITQVKNNICGDFTALVY